MICSRCPEDVSPANLTAVGDEKVCALCMYKAYEAAVRKPMPAAKVELPPSVPVSPASGFKVVDLPGTGPRRKRSG